MEKTEPSNKQNKNTTTELYANKLKQNRVNWSKVSKYFMKFLESKKKIILQSYSVLLGQQWGPLLFISGKPRFRDGKNRLF